ncbi:hypothetical protein [Pedobacter sp.]|uniref:hypothetical protein n=1 Tax=Pedobacter sp. TaxID=1411316 RepID=UPI003C55C05E
MDIALCLSRMFEEGVLIVERSLLSLMPAPLNQKSLILIAEDNPANMFLAKTTVTRIMPHSKIIEARNGMEAINLCLEND